MTEINFDMRRTGATIARLRRERNMTQMQLADDMGVSFQAVSNWERGQSMPDISKLPELANLFGTTIDVLPGYKSHVIEAAAADTLEALAVCEPIDPQELVQAAPLLTPKQVNEISDTLDILSIDQALIPSLLPFMDTDRVDALLRRAAVQGMDICEFLPFASEDSIDQLARDKAAKGEDICCMLPFMYEDTIDELAIERIRHRGRIDNLLPFVSSTLLNRLASLAFPEQ